MADNFAKLLRGTDTVTPRGKPPVNRYKPTGHSEAVGADDLRDTADSVPKKTPGRARTTTPKPREEGEKVSV